VTGTRERVIERLAERSLTAARIAVDGPDAAGKTTLADELAAALRRRGSDVSGVSIDDYLRSPAERYRLGRDSPEGYYRDSFDLDGLRRAVLTSTSRVVVEGVFLLRPELADLWDLRIYVDCGVDEILRRAAVRDSALLGDRLEALYRARYLPAQDRYRAELDPQARADVVVDNTDYRRPRLADTQ
jgi:uridine kinase